MCVTGSSQWCSHSLIGSAPHSPANESPSASGTLIHPPNTDSTASTTSGTVITFGASCRCELAALPVRLAPWKVMTIRRVM